VSDRYVIVYRDGSMTFPIGRRASDFLLRSVRSPEPAYRIRCREKAGVTFTYPRDKRFEYLDASRALYEVTGRRAPAGAEK
jgi:hypothetical protein